MNDFKALKSISQSPRSSKSTADNQDFQEYFNFSQNFIADVYSCSIDSLQFEVVEPPYLARALVRLEDRHLNFKVITSPFQEYSLSFYAMINIYDSSNKFSIKIPNYKSYNPIGESIYITSSQFLFLLKISSGLLKAALFGAPEQELSYIKNSISILPSYLSNKTLIDYMYIQVVTACYRRIAPPSLPEYFFMKVLTGNFSIRDDAKEYLDRYIGFIKGKSKYITLPSEYFSRLEGNDGEKHGKYKRSKGARRMLKELPKIVEEISYVEVGEMYKDLDADIKAAADSFELSIDKLTQCEVM